MIQSAAIMQPTFLPWMGYFALIDSVDHFVFLDDVQFSKQSWQSRNRVLGPNGPVLLSLPVARKPSKPLIKDAQLADLPVGEDILKRVEGCLGTAPFWAVVEELLREGFSDQETNLSAINTWFIRRIADMLGITVQFHSSHSFAFSGGSKSDRLLSICQALGVGEYCSPMGSIEYLREANPFSDDKCRLRFQSFAHPEYAQRWGEFVSHMSIIDALAYLGTEETAALMRSGTSEPLTLAAAERSGH